jgi:hypothetical protein
MPVHIPRLPNSHSGIEPYVVDLDVNAADLGAPEDFPLSIDVVGWTKTITQADGDTIVLAPRQVVTLTNEENDKTFTTVISGTFHRDVRPDGSVVETYTGRNLNFDPEEGFVLIAGHFAVTYDAGGSVVDPLNGTGQVTSVWDYLL